MRHIIRTTSYSEIGNAIRLVSCSNIMVYKLVSLPNRSKLAMTKKGDYSS